MRGYQVTGGTGQQLKSPAQHVLTGDGQTLPFKPTQDSGNSTQTLNIT